MKLHFKTIRFKNFMSFGNEWTEIKLDAAGTSLIIGKNGSGKSSAILDSLSFVLFNKPFRNIRKPQLMNSITNKNCVVETEFLANGFEFKVVRGLKPNIFEIFKDGELITQTADNRDYQDAFEKYILKVNHKTFCQIVMLGSAIFTPFMSLPALDRRRVIEDLLDLQVFSAMNTILAGKIKDIEKQISTIESDRRLADTKLTMATKHMAELAANRDDLINEKATHITNLDIKIKILNEEIEKFNRDITGLIDSIADEPKATERHLSITKLQYTLQHKVRAINKDIEFLQEHDDCPTCHQIIDPQFKEIHLCDKTEAYNEVDKALTELDEKFKAVDDRIGQINIIQKAIAAGRTEVKTRETAVTVYNKQIAILNGEIEELKSKAEEVDDDKLDLLKVEKSNLEKELSDVSDDRNIMGYAANLLKDTGIKARIIKNYIPVINQLLAKYLAAVDFFVDFQLDENFNEVIKSRFRDEFTYNSFSEGEKMRLNIAILFTWRAIAKLRGSIDTNLIICDEIFDGSMDLDGLEDMLKLINNLTNNENVFIISHKEDQLGDKFNRTIKFVKSNNFSKMVS